MSRWLVAFIGTVTCVVSLGLLSAPAGAVPNLVITALDGTQTYGGSAPTITAGYAGFVNGDTAASLTTAPSCTSNTTSSSPPGTYASSCSGAVDANYNITYATGTVTVGQANLVITASNGTQTDGGSAPTITAGYAGFVNGDTAASLTTAPSCTSNTTSSSPPGTYASSCSGAVDSHYNITYATGTVTVGPAAPSAPTIANLPGQGTYGGGFAAAVVTTIGSGTTSVTSSTPAVCAASGLSVSYVGVGTCSLNAQVAASPNYTAATGGAQSFNIGRAAATTPVISNIPSPANEFAGFTVSLSTTGDGTMSVTSNTSNVCSVDPNGITVTFVGFGTCSLTPSVAQGPNHFSATGNAQAFTVKAASHGYWLVGSDGGIFSFGTAAFFGSTGNIHLQRPVVGITPTSTRNGYWLVASDGGIFSFGDSSFYGSIPGLGLHPAGSGLPNSLNAPIVGMVPILTGRGYFMVASDGGVFSFGDARFEGSCPGIGGCSGSAVTVIPDHSGNGYWVVTADGGVYAFGDAPFYGSGPPVAVPVVDAVATPNGNGYWLLYANGAVAAFGAATALGGPIGYVNSFNPAAAIFRTADGFGYWVAAARGDVFGYGSAPYLGGMAAAGLNGQIIAAFGF
jgi:hypothetical protein